MIAEKEPVENLVTWVFEDGSFVPCAKIDVEEKYSIVSDYLGTPTHAYNTEGKKVWERDLDIYGATREQKGKDSFIPYLYQSLSRKAGGSTLTRKPGWHIIDLGIMIMRVGII